MNPTALSFLHAEPVGDPLLDWLYARINDAFDRAQVAAESRDLAALAEAHEEHKMLTAMLHEARRGETLQ